MPAIYASPLSVDDFVKKTSIILKSADSKVELDRNAIERVLHDDDEAEEK